VVEATGEGEAAVDALIDAGADAVRVALGVAGDVGVFEAEAGVGAEIGLLGDAVSERPFEVRVGFRPAVVAVADFSTHAERSGRGRGEWPAWGGRGGAAGRGAGWFPPRRCRGRGFQAPRGTIRSCGG